MTVQIDDSYITTVFETKFHSDKTQLVNAIKEMFQKQSRLETQEYNLLKAYETGDLSIGQISNILNISKNETMELLEKYNIPLVDVDEAYLEQEFNAFN